MKIEKILFENWCEKVVQTTIKTDQSEIIYTQRYVKEYHKSYTDGYIWRLR